MYTDLLQRTRFELNAFKASFQFETSDERVDLPVSNIVPDSVTVYYKSDGTEVSSTNYEIHELEGVIVFDITLSSAVVIEGEHGNLFSDEHIEIFVRTAFDIHTHGENRSPVNLGEAEKYLVTILAKIEALWVLVTDAAYDTDIRAPDGVTVPRSQRYTQLMALIEALKAEYAELSSNLGVGYRNITEAFVRRVSHLTGRLVPLFQPREMGDNQPAQRIYPGVNSYGVPALEVLRRDLKIAGYPLRAYRETIEVYDEEGNPRTLSDYPNLRARLRKRPDNDEEIEEFEIIDTADHEVTIKLSKDQVDDLRVGEVYGWDLLVTEFEGTEDEGERTLAHGNAWVLTEARV